MADLEVPLPAAVRGLAQRSPDAYQNVVDAAVRLLRGPRSLWPVDTGRSKRAWRRIGSGYSSVVYNPLHYASFVEDQQGRPAARTLQRFVGVLRRAARNVLTETDAERQAEALLGIRTAVAARERLEADRGVLSRYFELYLVRGRAPLIPRGLRIIDRQIRRRASRGL